MNTPIYITLNLAEGSILLNEGVLTALGWPRHVQMMLNRDEKKLLLRTCAIDDKQAYVIPQEHIEQFEISGRSLFKTIRQLVGWKDDRPRLCFGEYLPAHQAIRFSLADAEPLDIEGGYHGS